MKTLVVSVLLLAFFSAFAQNGEKNFIDQNYIEVTGKAEMKVVPDLIYMEIILKEKDNKNKQSLDEMDRSMTGKLTELGIDISKDLSVKDFSSSFRYSWISKADIILTKDYQLIVHDTKTLQRVYFELQNLGISNVSIIKLDHSRIEQYRREVKINAIKAAKEKAEFLASSINQAIGKAIYIQELENGTFMNGTRIRESAANFNIKSASDNLDESSTQDVEFEKINLEYSILVRFELK